MTEAEIAAVVKMLAPIIRETVAAEVHEVRSGLLSLHDVPIRLKAIEDRPIPRDGRPGEKGERGDRGLQGLVGERGPEGPAGLAGLDGRPGEKGERGDPGLQGLSGERGLEGPPGLAGRDGVQGLKGDRGDIGPIGERGPEGTTGVHGRDGLPGVAGANGLMGERGLPGEKGADGLHGRDGTLEHLQIAYDGERTVTFAFKNGDPVDGGVLRLPIPIYRDMWTDGKQYDTSDIVRYSGSMWFCRQPTTTKPMEGSKAWSLCVLRGRDGKDGKDAEKLLPVVRA